MLASVAPSLARHQPTAISNCIRSCNQACSYTQLGYGMDMGNAAHAVQPDGMARPTANTVQITFRIPKEWLEEADEVADVLSRPGMRASRTDAFRAAVARGFAAIKADAVPPPDRKSEPKTKKR